MRTRFSGLAALFACSLVAPVSAQPCCQPNIAPAALNGRRPVEIDPGVHPCGFLQFAWQDFIALNWPPVAPNPNNTTARARGLPDSGKVIGQGANDNPTVWEQSQPNWYLFWANNPPAAAVDGKSFAAWNQDAWLPAACGPLKLNLPAGAAPPRILSSLSKFDGMPGVVQASSAPLIDQNGFYTRYEILLDYPAFNYINSNRFYLLPRVQAFAQNGQPFNFPVQSGNTPGATFLKAAWKPLLAADINSGRYHTAQAFLYTPAFGNVSASCAGPVPVGLGELHIVHKTQDFPQWMWATFEHIDNTPADPALPGLPPPQGWSFFSPGSTKTPNQGAKCPDGTSPAGACDFQPTSSHMGTNPNDRTGGPTQASRLNPIQKSQNQPALGEINAAVQTALI